MFCTEPMKLEVVRMFSQIVKLLDYPCKLIQYRVYCYCAGVDLLYYAHTNSTERFLKARNVCTDCLLHTVIP